MARFGMLVLVLVLVLVLSFILFYILTMLVAVAVAVAVDVLLIPKAQESAGLDSGATGVSASDNGNGNNDDDDDDHDNDNDNDRPKEPDSNAKEPMNGAQPIPLLDLSGVFERPGPRKYHKKDEDENEERSSFSKIAADTAQVR